MILLKKKKTISNNRLEYNLCQHKAKGWFLDKILFVVVWCGMVHCYCLLFKTIVLICSSELLLYLTSLRLLFLMGFTCQLLRMSSMADILYTTYCLLLLINWMWKTTVLLSVLLYVFITSLPNDEVMFL